MSGTEVVGLLLEVLGETALAASAAILLVLAARGSLRRQFGARIAYASWLLVPAAMVAVLLPARTVTIGFETGPAIAMPLAMSSSAAAAPAFDWKSLGEPLMLAIWVVGVLLTTAMFARRQRRFRLGLGRLRQIRRAGAARVYTAEALHGLPAALGLLRPRIVLPADFELRYTPLQRRLMLAHEDEHLRRGDLWINAAALALRCLHWFNPLLPIAARAFRHDQELACDARVMATHSQSRRAYGEAMFQTQLVARALPLACQWGYSHPLKERIAMLKQPVPTTLRLSLGTALVGLLTLGLAVTAWATQPAKAVAGDVPPPIVHKSDVDAGKDQPPPTKAEKDAIAVLTKVSGASKTPLPRYPAEARRAGIEGRVEVKFLLNVDGTVAKAEVLDSEPPGVFDQAAIDAVMQWRLPDEIDAANPVPKWMRTPIEFSLRAPTREDQVKHAGKSAGAPRPLAVTAPRYPESDAGKNGGHVMLRVTVQPDGSPTDLKVVESVPAGVFDANAIAAVRTWQFEKPESGKATQVLVPVKFAPEGQ